MEHYNGLFGNYLTYKFSDIYISFTAFKEAYEEVGLTDTLFTDTNLTKIYTILCAEYMNSHIANSDINQFNLKLFSTLWQYGPTFLKKLEYQGKIRALQDADLQVGSSALHSHAYNPSTAPSTDPLTYVDDQNKTNYTKSKLDAYMQAAEYLDTNFTKEFLDKFKKLFIKIAEPSEPLLYGDVD